MNRGDIVKLVREVKEKDKKIIEEKKHTISSDYMMAKLDITVIDNYTDTVETLERIEKELNELQDRILARNTNK